MCEYILFFNRFFVFASLWSWFFCVWGLCVCVYVYGLDFSCVRFMSVLSRLDLCYSFCFCLLTVLLLSFWWQVPADRAKRPTRLFQPFHFFSLLHFPLFQTFPLHNFYTFWREGKGEERRGEEACGRMGSKFFPLRTDFPPAGLRYNLSLFSDITHTYNTHSLISVKSIWFHCN